MRCLFSEISGAFSRMNPVRQVTFGYLSYAVLGWILLSFPICQTSTGKVDALAALFTSTSALSTTGLGVVSTGDDFNFLGQVVILLLIQIGGIGYMTFSSFICLVHSKPLSPARQAVGKTVFNIPDGFKIDKFIGSVLIFTLVIEFLGAMALWVVFHNIGVDNALWSAVFHSISAFCTAGFSLYNNNIEGFSGNVWINFILGILCYAGAIGFIVFVDFWRYARGKTASITLTSRIIFAVTAWIMVIGTFLIFISEPAIRSLPPLERLMAAFFQVMSASTTTGYNSIAIGGLSPASLFLLIIIMIIGASPAGTGGGLKTTTLSALIGVVRSVFAGREKVTFYKREIPEARIRAAIATLAFYTTCLFVGCYLLTLTDQHSFLSLFFEGASALGTVGLSTGITASLSTLGQVIIILMMFIGRVGPIVFGIALFFRPRSLPQKEDLAV